jgi:hypothetical protein
MLQQQHKDADRHKRSSNQSPNRPDPGRRTGSNRGSWVCSATEESEQPSRRKAAPPGEQGGEVDLVVKQERWRRHPSRGCRGEFIYTDLCSDDTSNKNTEDRDHGDDGGKTRVDDHIGTNHTGNKLLVLDLAIQEGDGGDPAPIVLRRARRRRTRGGQRRKQRRDLSGFRFLPR